MKTYSLFDFFDQRKPVSHLAILIFSMILTLTIGLSRKYADLSPFNLSLLFMLLAQLEVFIYLGARLFVKVNFEKSPGEVTRIVVVRFIIFLVACLLASMILYILVKYAVLLVKGQDTSKVLFNFIHNDFREWFKSTVSGLSFGAIIFIVLLWQTSLKREQKLREENLIFQNETLKNQVNPHFLFNSLNTLSSLINSHPETADIFIGRLSSIYRYILENSSKDKVPLRLELSFLDDYFYLHKIRDDNKIQLEISVKETDRFCILPVSLQILLENAVKHNMATREKPLKIKIYIEGNRIVVSNNLQKMATQIRSTGIGLKNLAQRVKLISGKEMIVEEKDTDFRVKLPLLG